ncbi:23S rRNA (uracil(1939)-C(5))-methyltransferase RlmD [Pseudodesulfovibrio sp. F-1]|uniref:23S rRNA (Uracil(1939)-C(5))-methyltransferase RlmD n=1 Tax=Pseudodesulfovibrio alkaliphilus TaxID=2661613 RepID=A0A7K1KKR1_9BACT|nr:23S rRNA (uracil(1939)-C(5))-methyltransferase RlmD [Pseudodesulfovibrio alkaliphilus]MUM76492.1 23S rRNA (uracil(1939)-C(5))-methyltransferase RlmD [Pseudodesulfovibrio alkaliphilus]
MPLPKDSLVNCDIESLAYGGRGVAHVDGMAVFVAGGLPGDTVSVRIVRSKKRFAEGVAEAVITPSAHRVEPHCVHFGTCGGCVLQHLAYEEQLAQKNAQVAAALARIGGVQGLVMDPPAASPEVWGYRNKMEFAFEQRQDGLHLGLRQPTPEGANRPGPVLDIAQCHLCDAYDVEIMAAVREFCRASGVPAYDPAADTGYWRHLVIRHTRAGEVMAHLITARDERKDNLINDLAALFRERFPEMASFVHSIRSRRSVVAFGERIIHTLGNAFVEERLIRGDRQVRYRLSPNAFFQTNTGGAGELFATIADFCALSEAQSLLDLYCGTGAIGIYLAGEAGRVIGVELSEEAVAKARESARLNGLSHCTFIAGSLEQGIPGMDGSGDQAPPDVVVVDPPRSGLHENTAQALLALGAPRIVAVSCDPATLARDVKRLSDRYRLTRTRAVDMFPHTHHIETVALLELVV